jgi:hypothetical protein
VRFRPSAVVGQASPRRTVVTVQTCRINERRERVKIEQYAIRLHHDRGMWTLQTAATSAAQAVQAVLTMEGAPERSVVWVAQQPLCDCGQLATRRVRESRKVVCAGCARAQAGGPVGKYVTRLPVTQWPRVTG